MIEKRNNIPLWAIQLALDPVVLNSIAGLHLAEQPVMEKLLTMKQKDLIAAYGFTDGQIEAIENAKQAGLDRLAAE